MNVTSLLVGLLAAMGVITTALTSVIIARYRRPTGNVGKETDADRLWQSASEMLAQSDKMRADLRDDLIRAYDRITEIETRYNARIEGLEAEMAILRKNEADAREEARVARAEVSRLRKKVAQHEESIGAVRREVTIARRTSQRKAEADTS